MTTCGVSVVMLRMPTRDLIFSNVDFGADSIARASVSIDTKTLLRYSQPAALASDLLHPNAVSYRDGRDSLPAARGSWPGKRHTTPERGIGRTRLESSSSAF